MDKIWIDKYAENIPGEISQIQYQSIIDLVDHASNKFPKHISFSNLGTSLSFQDTRLYSERLAAYMSSELSIVKGDKVAPAILNTKIIPAIPLRFNFSASLALAISSATITFFVLIPSASTNIAARIIFIIKSIFSTRFK